MAERYREICFDLVDELVDADRRRARASGRSGASGDPHGDPHQRLEPAARRKIAPRPWRIAGPILVSDELGHPQAGRRGIRQARRRAGRSAARASGTSATTPQTDVAGAQGAGLRAVWFDWEQIAYPADAPRPDMRIGRLSRIARPRARARVSRRRSRSGNSDGHAKIDRRSAPEPACVCTERTRRSSHSRTRQRGVILHPRFAYLDRRASWIFLPVAARSALRRSRAVPST